MKFIQNIRSVYDRSSLSPAVRTLLDQEELQGQITANRYRYFFVLLIGVAAFVNSGSQSKIGVLINGGGLLAYLAVTILHTLVLTKRNNLALGVFSYASVVFDYAILLTVLLAWYMVSGAGEFAFVLKNPSWFFLVLPIVTTLFQFRLRLVAFASFLFLAIHFALLFYGVLYADLKLTSDWGEYVLGSGVVLEDQLSSRPMVFLILTLSIGYTIYRSMLLTRRVGEIESQKQNLSRYFSPDVAAEISSKPEVLNVGARQKVTILFSDIRDFTAMSEGMTPDEISSFLSELRRRLTNAIFEHGGTLDKYIGDSIMAVFGTPRPDPEPGADSRAALHAGLAMRRELDAYNVERRAAGLQEIAIGIGLHTGEVFAGNIGYAGRMEYTVIGDAVNTASRIESLCKKLDRHNLFHYWFGIGVA